MSRIRQPHHDASSSAQSCRMHPLSHKDWPARMQHAACCLCRLEDKMGRRKGGQGIVAFATDANSSDQPTAARYALKLYSSPSAFDREQAAIMSLALQPAMPACHAIIDTITSINTGPLAGSVLPPVVRPVGCGTLQPMRLLSRALKLSKACAGVSICLQTSSPICCHELAIMQLCNCVCRL